jgi:hypothetical protein
MLSICKPSNIHMSHCLEEMGGGGVWHTQVAVRSRLHNHGTQIKEEYCTRIFCVLWWAVLLLAFCEKQCCGTGSGIGCIFYPGSGYGKSFSGSRIPSPYLRIFGSLVRLGGASPKISICEPRPRRITILCRRCLRGEWLVQYRYVRLEYFWPRWLEVSLN